MSTWWCVDPEELGSTRDMRSRTHDNNSMTHLEHGTIHCPSLFIFKIRSLEKGCGVDHPIEIRLHTLGVVIRNDNRCLALSVHLIGSFCLRFLNVFDDLLMLVVLVQDRHDVGMHLFSC